MSKEDKQSILQSLSTSEYESQRFSDHSWDQGSFSMYFSKRSGGCLIKELSVTATYRPNREFYFAHNNQILFSSSSLDQVVNEVLEFKG
tara:strand:- start:432 stop:698 length:267 start_codon:yes stop_codon:yes gene_type:complete